MSDTLHTKYRPSAWKEVLGQSEVVAGIRDVLKNGRNRAFLLTGEAGTGKTTIGRLIAKSVKCAPSNIIEVDAASNSGAEAARDLVQQTRFSGLGTPTRVVIMDEVQALSKQAWDVLLKPIEEPPKHLYWVLCTTEPGKVSKAIQTRCAAFSLKPLSKPVVEEFVERIAAKEGIELAEGVAGLIAVESRGSPRQALTMLTACARARSRQEAATLLESGAESAEAIDLCRYLMESNGSPKFDRCQKILRKLDGVGGESVRFVVLAYFEKIALTNSGDKALYALDVLDAFSAPYPPKAGLWAVALSLGRLCFAE